MPDIATLDSELNNLILQGKAMDAFEKFYAQNVVMQENTDEPMVGKDKNREREQQFFGNIEQLHEAKITATGVGDNVTFAEMIMDATFKGGQRVKMTEVCRRQWQDGQVVHERFYYKPQA